MCATNLFVTEEEQLRRGLPVQVERLRLGVASRNPGGTVNGRHVLTLVQRVWCVGQKYVY